MSISNTDAPIRRTVFYFRVNQYVYADGKEEWRRFTDRQCEEIESPYEERSDGFLTIHVDKKQFPEAIHSKHGDTMLIDMRTLEGIINGRKIPIKKCEEDVTEFPDSSTRPSGGPARPSGGPAERNTNTQCWNIDDVSTWDQRQAPTWPSRGPAEHKISTSWEVGTDVLETWPGPSGPSGSGNRLGGQRHEPIGPSGGTAERKTNTPREHTVLERWTGPSAPSGPMASVSSSSASKPAWGQRQEPMGPSGGPASSSASKTAWGQRHEPMPSGGPAQRITNTPGEHDVLERWTGPSGPSGPMASVSSSSASQPAWGQRHEPIGTSGGPAERITNIPGEQDVLERWTGPSGPSEPILNLVEYKPGKAGYNEFSQNHVYSPMTNHRGDPPRWGVYKRNDECSKSGVNWEYSSENWCNSGDRKGGYRDEQLGNRGERWGNRDEQLGNRGERWGNRGEQLGNRGEQWGNRYNRGDQYAWGDRGDQWDNRGDPHHRTYQRCEQWDHRCDHLIQNSHHCGNGNDYVNRGISRCTGSCYGCSDCYTRVCKHCGYKY